MATTPTPPPPSRTTAEPSTPPKPPEPKASEAKKTEPEAKKTEAKEAKVFEQSKVDVEDTNFPISVVDGLHQPGEGFEEKSFKVKALQISTGFDANGQPGAPGDYLVWFNGHWTIMKDLG